MANPIIEAKKLYKTYMSDGAAFDAIRDLSLEIYDGDFTTIMGSSGSGKSTLLYLLSGMDSITSGEVLFEGRRVDSMNGSETARFRRQSIGFVFQAINLVPNLTLFENVAIPGYLLSGERKSVDTRTRELLERMDLTHQAHRLPSQVSGGQQQRAAIARSLINRPSVLFADEPTGSLNSAQGSNVLDILSEVNRQGQTVVMVTHDVKAACRADRVLFIEDGVLNGDSRLEKYTPANRAEREREIVAYLSHRGW